MKNKYEVRGDVTAIFLNRRDGSMLETIIDTVDLPKVNEYDGTWSANWAPNTKSFYATGKTRKSPKDKQIVHYLHRWIMDIEDNLFVDHKNGNTLDNRISMNLRKANRSQNGRNRKELASNNLSGVSGVHQHRKNWKAQFKHHGKYNYVGTFGTMLEAEKELATAKSKLIQD